MNVYDTVCKAAFGILVSGIILFSMAVAMSGCDSTSFYTIWDTANSVYEADGQY